MLLRTFAIIKIVSMAYVEYDFSFVRQNEVNSLNELIPGMQTKSAIKLTRIHKNHN